MRKHDNTILYYICNYYQDIAVQLQDYEDGWCYEEEYIMGTQHKAS